MEATWENAWIEVIQYRWMHKSFVTLDQYLQWKAKSGARQCVQQSVNGQSCVLCPQLWIGRLILYSSVLYLLTCVIVYWLYLPEPWTQRIAMALPFFMFPVL